MGDAPAVDAVVGPETTRLFSDNVSPNVIDHFPFPTIRSAQTKALQTFEQALHDNKKYIAMELPCGIGKSPLAIAIGCQNPFTRQRARAGCLHFDPSKIFARPVFAGFRKPWVGVS